MIDSIYDDHNTTSNLTSKPTRVPLGARIEDLLRTLYLTREEVNSLNNQLDRLVVFCGAEAWVYNENTKSNACPEKN